MSLHEVQIWLTYNYRKWEPLLVCGCTNQRAHDRRSTDNCWINTVKFACGSGIGSSFPSSPIIYPETASCLIGTYPYPAPPTANGPDETPRFRSGRHRFRCHRLHLLGAGRQLHQVDRAIRPAARRDSRLHGLLHGADARVAGLRAPQPGQSAPALSGAPGAARPAGHDKQRLRGHRPPPSLADHVLHPCLHCAAGHHHALGHLA